MEPTQRQCSEAADRCFAAAAVRAQLQELVKEEAQLCPSLPSFLVLHPFLLFSSFPSLYLPQSINVKSS